MSISYFLIQVSSNDGDSYNPPITPVKTSRDKQPTRQQTLHDVVGVSSTKKVVQIVKTELPPAEMNVVSKAQYEAQEAKVEKAQMTLAKLQSMADNLDFEALPDKGALIQENLR